MKRPIVFSLIAAFMSAHLPILALADTRFDPAQGGGPYVANLTPKPVFVVDANDPAGQADLKAGCIPKTPVKLNAKTHQFDLSLYKPGEFVSLFILEKSMKILDQEQEDKVLCRKVPSLEVRFYLNAAESLDSELYFEVIEHTPGEKDVSYGEVEYKKRRAVVAKKKGIPEESVAPEDVIYEGNSSIQPYNVVVRKKVKETAEDGTVKEKIVESKEVRYGLNSVDYGITHKKLNLQYDDLYSKWGLRRKQGAGYFSGAVSVVATYLFLKWVYKKVTKKAEVAGIWSLVEFIASKGTLLSRQGAKHGMATVFDVMILIGLYWQVGSRVKDVIEDLIDSHWVKDEWMELDYLYRVLGSAYEHATVGKLPISAAFDVEGLKKNFQETDQLVKKEGPENALDKLQNGEAGETDQAIAEEELSQRRLAHLPSPDMKFTKKAFKDYFSSYAREDDGNGNKGKR